MNKKESERAEAIKYLRELFKPGDRVAVVLRHVSQSGMTRAISVMATTERGIHDVSWAVARAIDWRMNERHGGITVGGCGMDMGYHLVYTLSRCLYPDGFGVEGKGPTGRKYRPATRKLAAKAVTRGAKFYGRNGDPSGWDNDGGYALDSRWI